MNMLTKRDTASAGAGVIYELGEIIYTKYFRIFHPYSSGQLASTTLTMFGGTRMPASRVEWMPG